MDARDALGLTALAFAVYFGMRQPALYGDDGLFMLLNADRGNLHLHVHLLYLPLLALLRAALAPLELSWFEAAQVYSALGMALGVGCTHLAAHIVGLARRDAIAATVLVATLPAVMFFGTVVEKHGPGFAFDGLAYLATARLAVRPGLGRAAVLGAATGAAFLVHSFAGLLPVVVLPLFLALRAGSGPVRWPSSRELGACAMAAAVHGAIVLGGPPLLALLGFHQSAAGTFGFIADLAAGIDDLGAAVLWTVQSEWLWPFFPISVLWLVGFARVAARPLALAVAAMLVVYLGLTTAMLAAWRIEDHGAYMISLAWPLALLAHRSLPRGLVFAAAAVGLVAGVLAVESFAKPLPAPAYAAGFRAVVPAGRGTLVLAGGRQDLAALLVERPHVPFVNLGKLASLDPAAMPEATRRLDRHLEAQWAAERQVVLTGAAMATLTHPVTASITASGRLLAAHLRERYRHQPVGVGACTAFALRPE